MAILCGRQFLFINNLRGETNTFGINKLNWHNFTELKYKVFIPLY